MLKLADLIKTALNEVGCEELPSGCDDISVDQSFIENNISNVEQPVCLVCGFFSLQYWCGKAVYSIKLVGIRI